jgi:competence protein ComEC
MRSIFNEIPILKVILPLMVGVGAEIAAGIFLPEAILPLLGFSALSVLAVLYLFSYRFLKIQWQFRLRVWEGVAFSFLFTGLGFVLAWFHSTIHYPNHFSKFSQPGSFYVVTVEQSPLEKEKIITCTAEVEQVVSGGKAIGVQGKVLLNFLRNENSERLAYGDRIIVKTIPEEFDAPQNPEEFDFKLYQSFHKIYHRAFLKPDSWKLLSRNNGNLFLSKVYVLRNTFLQIIRTHITNANDFAVASAMLLGYRDFMTDEVVQAYASSGALHVLCVSGLHVGIIFVIMNSLLGWMEKRGNSWKIAKAVFIILFIWFYACLSGLSPSVMRAATMFTMVQAGKVMNRHVNIYNIIAASVLVLMLLNPFIITEIGFRLSYLAVIGIIYLQPKIYSWVVVKNKWLDKAWQITAVSIAAQIATFPIGLYYFHQFPNLFFISNLLVIPLSGVIMYIGVSLIVLHAIPLLGIFTGKVLAGVIWFLNASIFMADKIPYSRTEGISIAMLEMLMIYVVVIFACVYIETKKAKVALATLACVLLLAVMFSYDWYTDKTAKQLVVYKVKNNKALALLHNGQALYDFDEKLLKNRSAMLFHIRHHWWSLGITDEVSMDGIAAKLPFGKLISFKEKKVLIVDKEIEKQHKEFNAKLKVDYVVLSQNAKVYLSNLGKLADFKQVIFDSSNRPWRIAYWKKDCDRLRLKYWDVNEQGAFVAAF